MILAIVFAVVMFLMLSCSTLIIATALDAWVRCAFDNVSATQVASGQVDPEVEMDKVQQHAYRWYSNYFMKTQPTTGRFGLQQQD